MPAVVLSIAANARRRCVLVTTAGSVHDVTAEIVLEFQMWNVERFHSVERSRERRIDLGASASQFASHLSQRTQHARPIETLTFTVFAKTHGVNLVGRSDRQQAADDISFSQFPAVALRPETRRSS
jgi:hypothetical protein